MIKIINTIILCFVMSIGYGQEKQDKIHTGYVRIPDDRMLSQLTFKFENDYTAFIDDLEKEFGKPEYIDYWYIWEDLKIEKWSEFPCNLRIQITTIQILNIDKSTDIKKEVSITVETNQGYDLLETGADSFQEIKDYFSELKTRTFN